MLVKTRVRFVYIFFLLFVGVIRLFAQDNLQFIENKGQWEAAIHYKSEVPSGAFFLEKNGFTVLLLQIAFAILKPKFSN
jgi:hypothetical protein